MLNKCLFLPHVCIYSVRCTAIRGRARNLEPGERRPPGLGEHITGPAGIQRSRPGDQRCKMIYLKGLSNSSLLREDKQWKMFVCDSTQVSFSILLHNHQSSATYHANFLVGLFLLFVVFFYYKGVFCNSLLFKCMLPTMGADHEAPVMNAFLRGLLTLTNFLQAIQNPNDFTHQERAWNSVCPLVIKLKKFYCFSLRLGTDLWRGQKASPCSRRGNLGHFIDIILLEIRL